jgi:hypothetical protein
VPPAAFLDEATMTLWRVYTAPDSLWHTRSWRAREGAIGTARRQSRQMALMDWKESDQKKGVNLTQFAESFLSLPAQYHHMQPILTSLVTNSRRRYKEDSCQIIVFVATLKPRTAKGRNPVIR